MKDVWYGDNRDLVKWSVLFRIAERYQTQRIVQIAYYRPSDFAKIVIDDREFDLPSEVTAHFRNIRNIEQIGWSTPVTVFDRVLLDRAEYLNEVVRFVSSFDRERCLVFVDPDTGLQPESRPGPQHVLESEARTIWDCLKPGDVFVFYQHQTNRRGRQWIDDKKCQLERALGVRYGSLKIAQGQKIARDVVFYFRQKT